MKETRFKQTEIGVIAEDWEIKRLGNITDIYSGGTPDTNNSKYWGGNIPWMSSGELNKRFIYDVIGKITESGLNNSSTHWIPKECILIGLAGQGKTRGTAAMNFIPLCTNQSIAAIYPSDKFVSTYIYYYIDSIYDYLRKISDGGGGRGGLTKALIGNLNIPLPNKKEQNKIASALTSIDNLLLSLDKLIEKKRLIKQGAMQELLTGKKRLPGFTGEWRASNLGELCIIKDGTHQTPRYVENGIPFFSVENVTNNNFKRVKYITSEDHNILTKNYRIEKGDVLMTRIGSIGICKYIDWDVNASFYVSLALLKFKEPSLAKFFSFYSMTERFIKDIESNSLQFASPKKINLSNISSVRIEYPTSKDEMEAITIILSSIDKELESLEGKKAKYEQIKQGMMQQLLTGKIRLI